MDASKVLDPKWIDLQNIKGWIHECDDEHGECHTNRTHITPPSRLTVIDVKSKCVAEWRQGEPYLILSYVWGLTVNFELRLENRDELFQPNSLKHRWEEIPQTIRDAILLTAELGFQYLWVDSLCIVQDDEENKLNDINQMDSIYSCASIAIVAADGSAASHGLRGTGESPRCTTPQKLMNIAPRHQVSVHYTRKPDISQKVYFERGWTYQEFQLSPRLLIFLDDKVFWKCRTHERSEEHSWPNNNESLPQFQITTKMTYPDLNSYITMVREYNSRFTRTDNDVLAAFTGIMGAINRHFPGGFFHGLPEYYFDLALLWRPLAPLRRRASDDGRRSFPSWSWTGWHGPLDTYHMGFPEVDAETYPNLLTQWYKTASRDSALLPIRNEHAIYRSLRVSEHHKHDEKEYVSQHLASLRKQVSDEGWYLTTYTNYDKVERPCYCHPSLLGAFLHPLPIGQGPEKLQDTSLRYLRFKTNRAYLVTGTQVLMPRQKLPIPSFNPGDRDEPETVKNDDLCASVSLVTRAGKIAGVARLNSTFAEVQNIGESAEVVAISRGQLNFKKGVNYACEESYDLEQMSAILEWRAEASRHVHDDEDVDSSSDAGSIYEYQNIRKEIGVYEYYNVMWIEWEDGIAYRRAVGRVYKEAWEALDLEEVDVLLG
jgi:hypothetical protein